MIPFYCKLGFTTYKTIWSAHKFWSLSKNKGLEIQLDVDWALMFGGALYITGEGHDHPGWMLELDFAGLSLNIQYYDIRHWDDETGALKDYDNS